jgi:periplasmic divalent cation tolerance protein
MTILSVYAIFAGEDEAERIGRTVIEENLAACINILGPCRSIYRWKGAIETAEEVAAILKTDGSKVRGLIERVAALHSYDTPCITAWPVEAVLRRYADWVGESLSRIPR